MDFLCRYIAEFYAASPRNIREIAGAFYVCKNVNFVLLSLPNLHFQNTAWLMFPRTTLTSVLEPVSLCYTDRSQRR